VINVEILQQLENLIDIGKKPEELQKEINVVEVANIWNELITRYYVLEETQILLNFVEDYDLKVILKSGIKRLNEQIDSLEKLEKKYGIPTPERNRAEVVDSVKPETMTDKYIFQKFFFGIRSFLDIHVEAFKRTPSPKLRELFKEFLITEVEIYDKIYEYGKLKNWINEPPAFRI